MLRHYLLLSMLMVFVLKTNAQIGDIGLRNYFNSMVFLKDSFIVKQKINGKEYELYQRNPKTDSIKPYKRVGTGSGFLVSKDLDDYLVTAQHVAVNLSKKASLTYRNSSGNKVELILEDISSENDNWIFHPIADVAVLHLNLRDKDKDFIRSLEMGFVDYWDIKREKVAPDRFDDFHVVGYPLGLGANGQNISPITKKVRVSSDIMLLNRFDNGVLSPFYLLDDPSTSGFSGGPIVFQGEPLVSRDKKTYIPKPLLILGLVHGTISDPQDKAGRFSAIVPAYLIAETIDLAPSFEGEYVYKYPNGNEWSKRMYKNGNAWTVFSNFDPEGKPQEMGDLKDGTGTLYNYDKTGRLIHLERFENGIRLRIIPSFTTEELKQFGNFKPVENEGNN